MAEEHNNSFIHQVGETINNAIQVLGGHLDKIFGALRNSERGNGIDIKFGFSAIGSSLKHKQATSTQETHQPPITPRQKDPNVFPPIVQEPDKGLAAKIAEANRTKYGAQEFNPHEAGYGGMTVSPSASPSVGSKLEQLTNGVGMRQQFR